MEYVRNIKVHIEVDTNKSTYTLDLPEADAASLEREINEFLDGVLGR